MPGDKSRALTLVFAFFSCSFSMSQSRGDTILGINDAIRMAEENYHHLKAGKLEAQAASRNIDVAKYSRLPTVDLTYQANISTANNITGQFYPYGVLPMTGPVFDDNRYMAATGSAAAIF